MTTTTTTTTTIINSSLATGPEGLALVKHFEGFSAKPYLCQAGVPTIGYGTTVYPSGVKVTLKDRPVSEADAAFFLRYDLRRAEFDVRSLVKVPLDQNQFEALVSFQYNLGALGKSTLLKVLNMGDYGAAAEEFLKWNKARDPKTKKLVVLDGLTRRRRAERALFLGDNWRNN